MLSLKTDSSFFRKIAIGAIGSREVKRDMSRRQHVIAELERGSLEAKIWTDVKRKRVRIPDLVCTRCGQRIEVRAKTKPTISMSHSPTVPERHWNHGMIGADWIAFPICQEEKNSENQDASRWTRGIVSDNLSYWHEKEWVRWIPVGAISYFTVSAFRDTDAKVMKPKGSEEGSETTLIWRSCFAPITGSVESISDSFITIKAENGEAKRAGCRDMKTHVRVRDSVTLNQVIACNATPLTNVQLPCAGGLSVQTVAAMLVAKQLPVRFAGVKLARLNGMQELAANIRPLANDSDEDIYVRLEGMAYLCAVQGGDVHALFAAPLAALNKPDQLEAVIAIGEVGNAAAVDILAKILGDQNKDYFLRSAAAYCLGRLGSFPVARNALIRAFEAQSYRIREDALAALADTGFPALADLLGGLARKDSADIQAGCAEVVRWLAHRSPTDRLVESIAPGVAHAISNGDRTPLAVWLGGQLPAEVMRPALGRVLETDARLAYTLSVAWAFAASWVAPLHDSFVPPANT